MAFYPESRINSKPFKNSAKENYFKKNVNFTFCTVSEVLYYENISCANFHRIVLVKTFNPLNDLITAGLREILDEKVSTNASLTRSAE